MVKTEEASKVALFYSAPSSAVYNILASVSQAYSVADCIIASVAQDYYPKYVRIACKGLQQATFQSAIPHGPTASVINLIINIYPVNDLLSSNLFAKAATL